MVFTTPLEGLRNVAAESYFTKWRVIINSSNVACCPKHLTKNVCEVFGTTGYISTAYTYTPYGSVTATGNVTQPIQWSSEFYDEELALVYYNNRYYNSLSGRWNGYDMIEDGYNFYSFVNNNPVFKGDFLGNISYKEGVNCTFTMTVEYELIHNSKSNSKDAKYAIKLIMKTWNQENNANKIKFFPKNTADRNCCPCYYEGILPQLRFEKNRVIARLT